MMLCLLRITSKATGSSDCYNSLLWCGKDAIYSYFSLSILVTASLPHDLGVYRSMSMRYTTTRDMKRMPPIHILPLTSLFEH